MRYYLIFGTYWLGFGMCLSVCSQLICSNDIIFTSLGLIIMYVVANILPKIKIKKCSCEKHTVTITKLKSRTATSITNHSDYDLQIAIINKTDGDVHAKIEKK